MSVVSDILGAVGGQQGIAAGAADIIGSIKGTNVPQNVTYVQPPATSSSPNMLFLIGGAVVLVILVIMLKH